MKHKTYMQVTTWLFGIIGVAHLYRAFKGYDAVIGHLHVAATWSWLGAAAALYLCYTGYQQSK